MGVLHVPVTKDTFFAVEGRGAFVRRKVRLPRFRRRKPRPCGGWTLVGLVLWQAGL